MKRDTKLIHSMLIALRDSPEMSMRELVLIDKVGLGTLVPNEANAFGYHLKLCTDAGFVVAEPVPGSSQQEWRLTWAGHEALAKGKT